MFVVFVVDCVVRLCDWLVAVGLAIASRCQLSDTGSSNTAVAAATRVLLVHNNLPSSVFFSLHITILAPVAVISPPLPRSFPDLFSLVSHKILRSLPSQPSPSRPAIAQLSAMSLLSTYASALSKFEYDPDAHFWKMDVGEVPCMYCLEHIDKDPRIPCITDSSPNCCLLCAHDKKKCGSVSCFLLSFFPPPSCRSRFADSP